MAFERERKIVIDRIAWARSKYKSIFDKDLHKTGVQRRIQEIYRDCKIILRKIELARKLEEPEDLKEEIEEYCDNLEKVTIPNFLQFLEFYQK